MRTKWGLIIIIAIGFVFLLGSSLALVELGTSKTVCRPRGYTTLHRFAAPLCSTSGGTSPVVYVILVVAIVIGVICLAAGITVLAVRISATDSAGARVPPGQLVQGWGPSAAGGPGSLGGAGGFPTESGRHVAPDNPLETGGPFGSAGSQVAPGDAPGGSPPAGWYEVAPGGPKRWWDGTQWVLTRSPPPE